MLNRCVVSDDGLRDHQPERPVGSALVLMHALARPDPWFTVQLEILVFEP